MNLTTRYLALKLKCPLVAGTGPITAQLDNLRRLEDMGAGAVVLPAVFEEQIEHEQQLLERLSTIGADSYADALTHSPAAAGYQMSPAATSRCSARRLPPSTFRSRSSSDPISEQWGTSPLNWSMPGPTV